jgi:hypothetical protein
MELLFFLLLSFLWWRTFGEMPMMMVKRERERERDEMRLTGML